MAVSVAAIACIPAGMWQRALMIALLVSAAIAAPWAATRAAANTITVNSTSLTVAVDSHCTLIEAMRNATFGNNGYPECGAGSSTSNVIELQTGQTYALTGALTGANSASAIALPVVTNTLAINAHGSTITTTGAGAGAFRVFYVLAPNGSLTLNDLTLEGITLPDGADGAIYNDNGTLSINRCTMSGTRTTAGGSGGGAITSRACSHALLPACNANNHATLNVADSSFVGNESRSTSSAFGAGAGINTYAVGTATNTTTIARSRFHNNTATNQGAAVSNAAYDASATSTTTIDRSSVTANTTTGGTTPAFGGGLTNFVGKVYTGGAANAVATLTVTNTTIASNTAANSGAGDGYGGGIFSEVDCGFNVSCGGGAHSNVTLTSVTLYGNTSGRDGSTTTRGAGIWSNNNDPAGSVALTVRDSIVAGNQANGTIGNCRIINTNTASLGYNIASDGTCDASFHQFTEAEIRLSSLNFSAFTYYRAPQAGSAAIDRTTCNVSVDQIGTARPQRNACDIGAIEALIPDRTTTSDFNGDGRSDAGIFRPTVTPNALWYSAPSGGGAPFQIFFGTSGDIPVAGDYDGDGKTDAVIWRPSTGLWYGPRTGAAQIVIQMMLGQSGDIPVPCDYDGDGAIDPAIYRPSTGLWFGTRANAQTVVLNTNLGVIAGDIPVPADYNGDGRCDPGIMRAGAGPGGTNLWYSVPSGGGAAFQIYFGAAGDIPAPGDYDGDGKADAVIFRPSTGLWYGPRTGAAQIVTQLLLGQNGDIPIPGDYNGDGAADPAIYRPSTGLFYGVNAAGNTVVLNTNLGVAAGDIATATRPHNPPSAYPFGFSLATATASAAPSDAPAALTPAEAVALRPARPVPADAPHLAPLTPAWGSSRSHLVTVSVVDPHGAADIRTVYALIGPTLAAADRCVIAYDRRTNTLQLADDGGAGWSTPLAIGAAGTLRNAQCDVYGLGTSVTLAGSTLSLVVPITFDPRDTGPQSVFGLAVTAAGIPTGWQPLGTWTVPPSGATVASAAPLWGSGPDAALTLHVATPDGAAAVRTVQVRVRDTLTPRACEVAYDAATTTLRLATDDGTGWSASLPVGRAGTLANAQCTLRAADSAVAATDTTLTAVLALTFTGEFAGPKTIAGRAVDADGRASAWQPLGTWLVPPADVPTVALAAPLPGSATARTVTLTAHGTAPIASLQVLIDTDLIGVGSCWIVYDAAAGSVRLADDVADAWSPPVPLGGHGVISNARCAIHAAGSAAVIDGNQVTLTLAFTTDAHGDTPTTIFGLAVDTAGGSSLWLALGPWNR